MNESTDFTFDYCGETLVGTIDWNEAKDKPTVLCLHGSKPGNRNSITYLTPALTANGQTCLRFDYAGHGDSSGTVELATISHLIAQAKIALNFMDTEKPLTIIGSSLGGGPALSLLPDSRIENMILLAPGAWTASGYDALYEDRYNFHVKTEKDAAEAPVFRELKKYTGKFLHIIGENDTVISPEVTKQMELNSVNACYRKFIKVKDATHSFSRWFAEHSDAKENTIKGILDFINHTVKV